MVEERDHVISEIVAVALLVENLPQVDNRFLQLDFIPHHPLALDQQAVSFPLPRPLRGLFGGGPALALALEPGQLLRRTVAVCLRFLLGLLGRSGVLGMSHGGL